MHNQHRPYPKGLFIQLSWLRMVADPRMHTCYIANLQ